MKTEYNCLFSMVNTQQYAIQYLNHSVIKQLHSIFRYKNEMSVNSNFRDTALWVDKLSSFSLYPIDSIIWSSKILLGEIRTNDLVVAVLINNAAAHIIESELAITVTKYKQAQYMPNNVVVKPICLNKTISVLPINTACLYNVYQAILNATTNLERDYTYLSHMSDTSKWIEKERQIDTYLTDDDRTASKYIKDSILYKSIEAKAQSKSIMFHKAASSIDFKYSINANMLPVLRQGTRQRYIAALQYQFSANKDILVLINNTDSWVKHKNKITYFDKRAVSLFKSNGYTNINQVLNIAALVNNVLVYSDSTNIYKTINADKFKSVLNTSTNKKQILSDNGLLYINSHYKIANPLSDHNNILNAYKLSGYFEHLDMGGNIYKYTSFNANIPDDIIIDRLSKSYELLHGELYANRFKGANLNLVHTIFAAEKDVRRSLFILNILQEAIKDTSALEIQKHILQFIKHSDILEIFKESQARKSSESKLMAIDTLKTWCIMHTKSFEPIEHKSNAVINHKPIKIYEPEPKTVNKNTSSIDTSDEPIEYLNYPKPIGNIDVINQWQLTKTGDNVKTHDMSTNLTKSSSGDIEGHYIGLIKRLIDIHETTKEQIGASLSRYLSKHNNLEPLIKHENLNAYLSELLTNITTTNYDISFLTDIELVLTNPLYKDIMLDQWPIIIDDIKPDPKHPFYDWEPVGIDELLIPNEDYPWETVKNDIFDWAKGIPKDPIRRIDEHTFIAKMPTVSPIQANWDIGRKYIDIEVFWLKYIIDIFSRSWQHNIFKYGAMDMMSGINTMLEYMRLFITLNVSNDAQEQCERALSLIRWYAEHILLKHSQFIIHIEYGDWESALHTGELDIEHDWLNFEISPSFVITNTDNQAVLLIKSYVCIDAFISFSIFLDGDLDIYINNTLIAQLTTGCGVNQIFAVSAGPIEVKFDFTGTIIKLGNIIITNTHAIDIKTEYKYEYGKANFGINETLDSVKAYYALTQYNIEAFKQTSDGIIGLNDLTNQLNTYLELHHFNQQKGKRLTINRL